ncbi:hypothetical protein CDAR_122101 [Caerostris darwini]|uniref:Uncharacterized protein n=1 Tax=Caerostris darwini TaxID=1538125 RepID=A0AAV4NF87_9ARAC|nr:hypothetical protein CDAR_122101 [Caerostris darwini]
MPWNRHRQLDVHLSTQDSFQYCFFQTRHVSGIALSHPMQGSRFIHSYDSTVGARDSSPRVFVRKTSLSGDYYPPVPHTTLFKKKRMAVIQRCNYDMAPLILRKSG